MIRLFVSSPLVEKKSVSLSENQTHYLLHVMRQRVGDSVLCFNGQDGEWQCEITALTKKQGVVIPHIQTKVQTQRDFCALCPAIIKKEAMDFVLQKATELGVSDIYPLVTARTVVKKLNMERAQAIVQEAAEQSERLDVPVVHAPTSLSQILKTLPPKCACYYLSERENVSTPLPKMAPIAFFVGPEGGWDMLELEFFNTCPTLKGLHFPGGILRAETAGLAILSCWQVGRHLTWKK